MNRGSRGPGTTSPPTCRVPPSPPLHPGTLSRSARTTSRRSSRWRSSARRSAPSARSRSPSRSATPTGSTARARCIAPTGSSGRSIRPAHIYYKYEGVSPAGSHKPNTALAQAYYNKEQGVQPPGDRDRRRPVGECPGVRRRLLRARGQGLHGPRQLRPEAVPADPHGDLRRGSRRRARRLTTNYGRQVLAATPDSPGSLGIAISEAVEDAATRDDTKYSLGSVLNHVLLHQTVIGQEASSRWRWPAKSPDIIIGCTGGGSNFAGLTFPFLGRNFREGANHRIIAVEPEAAPQPDPRRVRLRLRGHRQDGAAREDAHARLRLHPGADPRRRPALPRHGARWSACSRSTVTSRRAASTSARASKPASSSPGPRASCPRPSRPTPSGSRSTRRSRPRRPARRG